MDKEYYKSIGIERWKKLKKIVNSSSFVFCKRSVYCEGCEEHWAWGTMIGSQKWYCRFCLLEEFGG